MTGPLAGLRVVELEAIGPAQFGGMVLADLGADVIRVDRAGPRPGRLVAPRFDVMLRGHRSVAIDLKHPDGVEAVLKVVEHADVLVEGYRPGVAERLGIGPDICCGRNQRLVYARMTGWGQDGPLARAAGHDVNFIAVAGALHGIGRQGDAPVPPTSLVGDCGGGGMLLAVGVLAAIVERASSGEGQVLDVAVVDGAALLTASLHGYRASGRWSDDRGTNAIDTGAHFYEVYETADHEHVAVGPVEPRFYAELIERLGLSSDELPRQDEREAWPEMKGRLAEVFRLRTRSEWCELLEGTDACFAPVLSMAEAPDHAHNRARSTFCEIGGIAQPAPAPRFSRSTADLPGRPPEPGAHTRHILAECGYGVDDVADLEHRGVVRQRVGADMAREPVEQGTSTS